MALDVCELDGRSFASPQRVGLRFLGEGFAGVCVESFPFQCGRLPPEPPNQVDRNRVGQRWSCASNKSTWTLMLKLT